MLDQHHRDVVAFLRVGNVDDRLAAGLEPHRLVVEHPVGDVVVAFLGEDIGRLPGFGEARPEPAARPLAGQPSRCTSALLLMSARSFSTFCMLRWVKPWPMNSQLRSTQALTRSGKAFDRDAVDVHHARNLELVIDLQQPPEADAVAVFVPAPVRNVGHRRAAGRRREHRARHGLRRVPFLDIGDGPHHHARLVRQLQRLAVDDRANSRCGRPAACRHWAWRSSFGGLQLLCAAMPRYQS